MKTLGLVLVVILAPAAMLFVFVPLFAMVLQPFMLGVLIAGAVWGIITGITNKEKPNEQ